MTTVAYYGDLSDYIYHHSMFYRPNTKTVGWLALGHEFPTTAPSNELLDALWAYCKVSVAQMRGIHECEFCPGEDVHNAERNGELLLLGTSEIRVFSETGEIFAAPTLIYHYVRLHQYAPPAVFVRAVLAGPAPPDPEYFARLSQVGLDWNATSRFAGPRRRLGQPVPGGS